MKKRNSRKWFFTVFCVIFMVLFTGGQVYAEFIANSQNGIKGQYIVTYKPNVAVNTTFGAGEASYSAAQVASDLLSQYGVSNESVLTVYQNAIEGFAARMDEATAIAISQDSKVEMVEQDSMAYATDIQNNPTWGIDRVDQRDLPCPTLTPITPRPPTFMPISSIPVSMPVTQSSAAVLEMDLMRLAMAAGPLTKTVMVAILPERLAEQSMVWPRV